MSRTTVINFLINQNNYKSYLEIGIRHPVDNFAHIKAEHKDGVDPAGDCNYVMTSDAFFAEHDKYYDIIFVDGLHLYEQALRDVNNALAHLNKNGTIVLHDCDPGYESYQLPEPVPDLAWMGTVWKAFATLRMTRPDLSMCTINDDCGLGIITRGNQELFPRCNTLDWNFLESNRDDLLKRVSVEQFQRNYVKVNEK